MKYIRMQRTSLDGIITIGEYIKTTQPWVYMKLTLVDWAFGKIVRDVTEAILQAADISGKDKQYAAIMTERPKLGRGGLLPGEKAEQVL